MKFFKQNLLFLKLIAEMVIVSAFFISCKKPETGTVTTQPAEAAPISATFLNGNYNVLNSSPGNFEFGTQFSVVKNGKILKLGTRMPKAGTYRVTLWDTASVPQIPLAQAMVTQTYDEVIAFSPITPVVVVAGKVYVVSLWSSGPWFLASPMVVGFGIPYPITSGNITITGHRWLQTLQGPVKYPANEAANFISGFADIEFKAD